MVSWPLETTAEWMHCRRAGHEPPTCLPNGGVRGDGAKSEEEKDRGLRRGSREGADQADGAGWWSAAASVPVG